MCNRSLGVVQFTAALSEKQQTYNQNHFQLVELLIRFKLEIDITKIKLHERFP